MALSFKFDNFDSTTVAAHFGCHRVGLIWSHGIVIRTLQQKQRCRDVLYKVTRASFFQNPSPADRVISRAAAQDETLHIVTLELVGIGLQSLHIAYPVGAYRGRERIGEHAYRRQRAVATGTSTKYTYPGAVRELLLYEIFDNIVGVLDIGLAPETRQLVLILPSEPDGTSVVDCAHGVAPRGPELDCQVQGWGRGAVRTTV